MIKRIFIYWGQSFKDAPKIVKSCLSSWKKHNLSWDIVELDSTNINDYVDIESAIPELKDKEFDLTAFSDILRIFLLKKYGGLWCDATTFCNFSLDEWLEKYTQQGFFAFANPAPDRLLSSWFLYAEPDNYIVNRWYDETIKYWNTNNKAHDYFWFHYLFGDVYKADPRFAHLWDSLLKLPSDEPHYLQDNGLFENLNVSTKTHIDDKKTGLYKLTYKYDESWFTDPSTLRYLINPRLQFIHIGKCAGTYIGKTFGLEEGEFHLIKPVYDYFDKYIIWIRNPLHRFVSAFNHALKIINTDVSKLDVNNLTLDNCQAPEKVKFFMQNNYAFSIEYDHLISYFGDANTLAESLSSTNEVVRDKAMQLMTSEQEHLYKGIGWYLDNGEFVEKYYKNILMVGRAENMMEDSRKLAMLIDFDQAFSSEKIRENKMPNRYLSDLAIENLFNFYKDSDYKALHSLYKHKLIDKATLDSYHTYNTVNGGSLSELEINKQVTLSANPHEFIY